ncbi:MAG: bifunctional phosphoribosylaminoimidazolecarboxamide formyltransferase/IMP cyclohydrolase [Phycisphaerales bacterium]|nr:bifunctional phosphoribosylaminoimidazolecarboxamide formyltransferase/IMP cyclohydrolase [Phycisphaerales bacterium]
MKAHARIRRALLSVHNKEGIVDFARALHTQHGIELISTGGTAKTLRDAGIPVTLVEDLTGSPEFLDGRVKTLHPRIFGAILANRDNPRHMEQLREQGIQPIDMVVVNLYPFFETVHNQDASFEQAIEMIDIGGVSLLRAAAKNHRHVLVVDAPTMYAGVLDFLRGRKDDDVDPYTWGGFIAFKTTADYDAAICTWLSAATVGDGHPLVRFIDLWSSGPLRYGENPHQTAELLGYHGTSDPISLANAEINAGKDAEMSYNNFLDADAAIGLCRDIARTLGGESATMATCVFVKHTNPCGVGIARSPVDAYRKAYLGDANAAMGGILACNFGVDETFAKHVMETFERDGKAAGAGGFFVEVWIAPEFSDGAVKAIRRLKKWGANVRLVSIGDMTAAPDHHEPHFRKIAGGMLVQFADLATIDEQQWKTPTRRSASDAERADMRLAWLIAKHAKSNAIAIVRDGQLLGCGAGQMSRVMSCRIATWLAKENGHSAALAGATAASDGFFPFSDGPALLMDAGVTALIQPGGSKRDAETVAACDERGAAMIVTGTRHFRH